MLRMFNLMKRQQVYPKIFQSANISSFYKKKGDKSDLNNDRGVFNVVKIRSILDKLIYNDIYSTVDSSMSSSNIGARRNRNIRDHLFVINGILNDVQQNKKNTGGVDLGIYDIAKCFDKMWYRETANDIYKAGVQDDKFILIANSNKQSQVAVKTPWGGLTNRIELKELEMQGTVISNIKCSVQIDSLGKDCLTESKGIYKYKDCISIPPLSMVDDVITVSSCGVDSIAVNAIVQAKVECKRLELGPENVLICTLVRKTTISVRHSVSMVQECSNQTNRNILGIYSQQLAQLMKIYLTDVTKEKEKLMKFSPSFRKFLSALTTSKWLFYSEIQYY